MKDIELVVEEASRGWVGLGRVKRRASLGIGAAKEERLGRLLGGEKGRVEATGDAIH